MEGESAGVSQELGLTKTGGVVDLTCGQVAERPELRSQWQFLAGA